MTRKTPRIGGWYTKIFTGGVEIKYKGKPQVFGDKQVKIPWGEGFQPDAQGDYDWRKPAFSGMPTRPLMPLSA